MFQKRTLCQKGDEYRSTIAETVKEVAKLVEFGFHYVCDIDGVKLFKKPK